MGNMTVEQAGKYLEQYSAGPLTYTAESRQSIFVDNALAAIGGSEAQARRARVASHERDVERHPAYSEHRALNTTVDTGGTLVAPEHLTSDFATAVLAAAPLIAVIPHLPATRTDYMYTPSVSSPPSAAVQANQGDSISNTGLADAFQSNPISTFAAGQTISRQLYEQGDLDIDAWLMPMLGDAIGATANTKCWSGAGSGGEFQGIDGTSGVQSVNAASWNSYGDAIAKAQEVLWSNRLRRPTHLFLHPSTWMTICQFHDSQLRPFVLPHPGGQNFSTDLVAGQFQGLNVVLDVTVTSGVAYVLRQSDLCWFSAGPFLNSYTETLAGQLSIQCVAHLYGTLVVRFSSGVVRVTNLLDVTPGS